jgi:hypothetical protein
MALRLNPGADANPMCLGFSSLIRAGSIAVQP